MLQITYRLLDKNVTPLGSFTSSSTMETLVAIQYWCGRDALSVRSVGFADKLVQRFAHERASGNLWAKDKAWTIPEMYQLLAGSWIIVGGTVGLERAEVAWSAMIALKERGVSNLLPTISDVITATKKWLVIEDGNADRNAFNAASLLLKMTSCPDVVMTDEFLAPDVIILFGEILKGLTILKSADATEAGKMIIEHLKSMEIILGWDVFNDNLRKITESFYVAHGCPPSDEAVRGKTLAQATPDTEATTTKSFRDFSHNTIEGRQGEKLTNGRHDRKPEKLKSVLQDIETPVLRKDAKSRPELSAFVEMMNNYARERPDDAAEQATNVLKNAVATLQTTEKIDQKSLAICFNTVLQLWSEQNDTDEAPVKIQEVLDLMEKLRAEGLIAIQPNLQSYRSVLTAWTKSSNNVEVTKQTSNPPGKKLAAEVADGDDQDVSPEHTKYEKVISECMMNTDNEREVLLNSGSLYGLLTRKHVVKNVHLNALWSAVDCVVGALIAKGFADDAGTVIQAALEAGYKPVSSKCRQILERCSKSLHSGFGALRLLEKLELSDAKPNFQSYEAVVLALLRDRKGDSNEKAMSVLFRLLKLHKTESMEIDPNLLQQLMAEMIMFFCRVGRPNYAQRVLAEVEKESKIPPLTTELYNIIMKAWSKAENVEKVENVFQKLLDRIQAGNYKLGPDTASIDIVLRTLSKSRKEGAAEKADKILQQMIDLFQAGNDCVKLDENIFMAVILAYMDVSEEAALDRSVTLIEQMNEIGIEPSRAPYNAILNAYKKSNFASASRKADDLLKQMITSYQKRETVDAKPNSFSFGCVIGCTTSPQHGLDLINRMIQLGIEPTTYTFNILLNTCAQAGKKGKAEKIAALSIVAHVVKEFRTLKLQPDEVTQNSLIKAYQHLLPRGDDQTMIVETAFQRCFEAGVMSSTVFKVFEKTMQRSSMKRLVEQLVGGEHKAQDEWLKNVLMIK